MPQVPTATGIKICSAADAHLLFYAVVISCLFKSLIHSTASPARQLSCMAPLLPCIPKPLVLPTHWSTCHCPFIPHLYIAELTMMPIPSDKLMLCTGSFHLIPSHRVVKPSHHPPLCLIHQIGWFWNCSCRLPSHLTWQLDDYGSWLIHRTSLSRLSSRTGHLLHNRFHGRFHVGLYETKSHSHYSNLIAPIYLLICCFITLHYWSHCLLDSIYYDPPVTRSALPPEN
jgi:hypothetical protein